MTNVVQTLVNSLYLRRSRIAGARCAVIVVGYDSISAPHKFLTIWLPCVVLGYELWHDSLPHECHIDDASATLTMPSRIVLRWRLPGALGLLN
jgi:hypothetical protein